MKLCGADVPKSGLVVGDVVSCASKTKPPRHIGRCRIDKSPDARNAVLSLERQHASTDRQIQCDYVVYLKLILVHTQHRCLLHVNPSISGS